MICIYDIPGPPKMQGPQMSPLASSVYTIMDRQTEMESLLVGIGGACPYPRPRHGIPEEVQEVTRRTGETYTSLIEVNGKIQIDSPSTDVHMSLTYIFFVQRINSRVRNYNRGLHGIPFPGRSG
jgi:hypothetical protein